MLSFHYTIFYAVMCYSLCIDIGVITNAELSRKINSTQLMLDFLTDAIIDSWGQCLWNIAVVRPC